MNPNIQAQFNQILGPVPANGGAPSRADEIRALGKQTVPVTSSLASTLNVPTATTNPNPNPQFPENDPRSSIQGIIPNAISGIQSAISKGSADLDSAGSGNTGNMISKSFDLAGDVAGGVLSPINSVIGGAIGALGKAIGNTASTDPNSLDQRTANFVMNLVDKGGSDFQALQDKHPWLKEIVNKAQDLVNIGGVALLGAAPESKFNPNISDVASGIKNGVGDIAGGVSDAASTVKNKVTGAASSVKEALSPTLTPEEQVGKIIQGKTSDIPAAQRTFKTLSADVNPAKLSSAELSDAIQSKIHSNMSTVDTHYANDNTLHPMSDFEQTVGQGKSEVKVNPVQDSIDNLKAHYAATKDAQGLSSIKALEEKANTEGLSSKELNDLAKEQGKEIDSYKANGDLASSVKAQAAENTRAGVKAVARNTLAQTNPEGAAEVTRLDRETSDAIHTKDVIDNQAQREATGVQKKGKPGAISKFTKAHPIATKLIKIGAGAAAGKAVGGTTGEIIGAVGGGL